MTSTRNMTLPHMEHDTVKHAKEGEIPLCCGNLKLRLAQDQNDANVGSVVWPCTRYLVNASATNSHVVAALQGKPYLTAIGEKPTPEPGFLAGRRILELGSGTGFVGLALALMGADVTLTEQPSAMPLLEHNVALFTGDNAGKNKAGTAVATTLDWHKVGDSGIDLAAHRVLVASECLYAVENLGHSYLVDVVAKFLKAPREDTTGVVAILAYETRDDDIEESVIAQLKAHKLHVHALKRSAPVQPSEGNDHALPVHYVILAVSLKTHRH